MLQDDKNKLNRIEDLKSKLFSKGYQTKTERRDGFSFRPKKDVPEFWEGDTKYGPGMQGKFFTKTPVFKRLFIFSIIFFVLALGYASYMFFVGGNTVSSDNIDISVLGNSFTAGGEGLPLIIGVTNRNSSPIESVDLVVEYPKSSADNSPENIERLRQSIGTIPAGEVRNENVKVILFGEQGSTRKIRISLEYRVGGSNSIFVKEKFYDILINSSPISLTLDAPTEVSPNQDINLDIKETLNATRVIPQMLLRVDYPVGFQFVSANPAPTFGNNIWDLGDLAPGTEHSISVLGKMLDVFDGEQKTFKVWSGSRSDTSKSTIGVIFSSIGQTVAIKKPFIEAKLFVDGLYKREYASDSKTKIQGEIHWVNNLDTKINDMEIRAKISGNAVNRKTIETINDGFYDSLQDTIIWNKNLKEDFKEINPGESGTVNFSLSPLTSLLGEIISNPAINIEVSVSGKQAQEGDALKQLNNSESKIIRIISDAGLAAKGLYYSGPFKNTGPIPPTAEKETTYTVVWDISNTANSISQGRVRSTLPQWVRFIGTVSPENEDLNYNPSTKEIIWNIGSVPKGTGINTPGREVSFQVGFTPSLSQVGTSPVIINDAVLTGHDDFANVDINVNKSSLNTKLGNDPIFPFGGDRVVE